MSSPDALVGRQLDGFRVRRLLGRGGMGAVYEGEDLALRRPVALKVLLPEFAEDPRARTRFQREIGHAASIEHPHVVPVYSAGYEPPHFFIAMRLVRGPDLASILRSEGAMNEDRALRLLGQVASALHAVHARGVVHRDIKPHNVLVWDAGGEDEQAMLTDFGIAKAVDDTRNVTGGAPIGTVAYMAPEVWLGQTTSPAADQYSLAVMAYEMLSGGLPFSGDAVALRQAHVETEPTSLAETAPRVSPAVARAVDQALAKSPSDRHPDIRGFVRSAKSADDAFRRSQQITRALIDSGTTEERVRALSVAHGLPDDTVAHLTELDRTEVVRLRRRQARRALVGRRSG